MMRDVSTETKQDHARLLSPRTSLAGLIMAGIARDTRGLDLPPDQCFNFFPASPLCALTYVFEGALHDVDAIGRVAPEPLPPLFLSGHHRSPIASWSDGPVLALTVGLWPEAWGALTGMDIERLVDHVGPLDAWLDARARAPFEAAARSRDVDDVFASLQDALEPLWRTARPKGSVAPYWLEDWARGLAARAALSDWGRGARRAQRSFKAWAGQSRRDLARHVHVEALFARTRARGALDLAALAAEAGYADQSHMGREVKRVTGQSPAKLAELVGSDEGYWCYRLLGERY